MRCPQFAVLAAVVLTACDMPTDAASARDHLDDDASTSLVVRVPMPAVNVNLQQELVRAANLEEFVDAGGRIHVSTPRVDVEAPHGAAGHRITHSVLLDAGMLGSASALIPGVKLVEVMLGLEVTNTSTVTLDLTDVRLTLVDAGGVALRGAGGSVLELDLDRALDRTQLAPGSRAQAAAVATEMGNEILARLNTAPVGVRIDAGILAVGTAPVRLQARLSIEAPLELQVPAAGLSADYRVHSLDAAALVRAAAALRVADRPARLELDIENDASFGADVAIALAPTPADTTGFDAFSAPGRIVLQQLRVQGATSAPSRALSSIALTESLVAGFEGRAVTASVRIRLLPDAAGRIRLDADDRLRIEPTAVIGGPR